MLASSSPVVVNAVTRDAGFDAGGIEPCLLDPQCLSVEGSNTDQSPPPQPQVCSMSGNGEPTICQTYLPSEGIATSLITNKSEPPSVVTVNHSDPSRSSLIIQEHRPFGDLINFEDAVVLQSPGSRPDVRTTPRPDLLATPWGRPPTRSQQLIPLISTNIRDTLNHILDGPGEALLQTPLIQVQHRVQDFPNTEPVVHAPIPRPASSSQGSRSLQQHLLVHGKFETNSLIDSHNRRPFASTPLSTFRLPVDGLRYESMSGDQYTARQSGVKDEHILSPKIPNFDRRSVGAGDATEVASIKAPSPRHPYDGSDPTNPLLFDDAAVVPSDSGESLIQSYPQLSIKDWDSIVVSSASSLAPKSLETGLSGPITDICTSLLGVFRDLTKYRSFLCYRGEEAQFLLDTLQTLLDQPQLSDRFRLILFVALVRLTRKSGLYPQCFNISDINFEPDPVATGSSGEVHKGYFQGRVVSVKIIKVYWLGREAGHKPFFREAVLWGQLSHPNVVPFIGIYRLGDRRNRIGLVSPWMENGNLDDFLERHPNADRRLLISGVAAGMEYLHLNGVVHGDLKPANILVDDDHNACLTDFGLSSVEDIHGLNASSLSSGVPPGGTVRYLGPELINPDSNSQKSTASDVFAFALVGYFIFTGFHPFQDVKEPHKVLVKLERGDRPARPKDPECLARGLTGPMWRLLEDCWEHNLTYRPKASVIVARLSDQISDKTAGDQRAGS